MTRCSKIGLVFFIVYLSPALSLFWRCFSLLFIVLPLVHVAPGLPDGPPPPCESCRVLGSPALRCVGCLLAVAACPIRLVRCRLGAVTAFFLFDPSFLIVACIRFSSLALGFAPLSS